MTLAQLFAAREQKTLTYAAYKAIGGLEGAIASHAERVFATVSPAAQETLDALLRMLVADIDQDGRLTIRTPDRASVGFIAHSATGSLDGWNLDYAQLLGTVSPGSDWIGSLSANLEREGIHVDTWATASFGVLRVVLRDISIVVFFIPIALWISWYGFGRRFRHRVTLSWAKSR